jgi:hypothetical protein
VDLVWDSIEARQQGFIDGGTILLDKKKQDFTFGTLFCALELFGYAWESGTHVFSIEQPNQMKTTHPKAHSFTKEWGRRLGAVFRILGRKLLS